MHILSACKNIAVVPFDWVLSRTPKQIFACIAVLDIFALVVLGAILFLPHPARFSLDARSDIATLIVRAGEPSPPWGELSIARPPSNDTDMPLSAPEAAIRECTDAKLTLLDTFKGDLRISLFTKEGVMVIVLDAGDDQSLGKLDCANGNPIDAPNYVVAELSANYQDPPIIKFAGDLIVGGEVMDQTTYQRLLLEGNITVNASSWPFGSGNVTSRTDLMLGDKIQFFEDSYQKPSRSFGIFKLENNTIRIISYSEGKQAEVQRLGSGAAEPLVVAPTILARLLGQVEWAMLLAVAAILLNFLGSLSRVVEEHAKDSIIDAR
jgi:hypothetical protein